MAYTKAMREQKQAKQLEEEKKTSSINVEKNYIQPKKKLTLTDNVSILVSSNVFGLLTYVNHKTGDVYKWKSNNKEDSQSLYVADIRAMKSNQPRFFEENWIFIEGIADKDEAYENIELDEVYEALQIAHYYKDAFSPRNLNDVFNWTTAEMKEKIPHMKQSVKDSLIVRANELIKEGILDSISKVKALEAVLNCELTSPED